MNSPQLESSGEIEKITRNILITSKAWGRFPTPVDTIAQLAELQIENGVDLSAVEPGFFTANFHFVKTALSKVIGLVDFRQKTIYLDHKQLPSRKNFVKLHEVGHKACSWQSALGYMDDEATIDPDIKEEPI